MFLLEFIHNKPPPPRRREFCDQNSLGSKKSLGCISEMELGGPPSFSSGLLMLLSWSPSTSTFSTFWLDSVSLFGVDSRWMISGVCLSVELELSRYTTSIGLLFVVCFSGEFRSHRLSTILWTRGVDRDWLGPGLWRRLKANSWNH